MSIAVTSPSTVEASCIGQVKKLRIGSGFQFQISKDMVYDIRLLGKEVKGSAGYQVKIYEKGDPSEKEWYARTQFTKKIKAYTEFSSLYALKGKVRAYKMIKGKKVYGKWSKTVKKIINY